jgi:hypothetical protein
MVITGFPRVALVQLVDLSAGSVARKLNEEVEPGPGWPHAAILGDLTARPSMTPAELGPTGSCQVG